MRHLPRALIVSVLLAGPAPGWAQTVAPPGAGVGTRAPSYRNDSFVLRLHPAAARDARAATGNASMSRLQHLGLAGPDGVADELAGAWFEPEFPGETPPAEGSSAPDFTCFYVVHLPPGIGCQAALGHFRLLAEVESATPIAVMPVAGVPPDDSLWSVSFYLDQPSGHDIHALEAWDRTTGDTSIVIAILDSGVVPYHPDIGGRTPGGSGNLWVNWAEKGGLPGVDDDHNGFVDDVSGWDFVSLPSDSGIRTGEDWRDADNDPNDFSGHGTAVAGIAGALSNNGIGMTGAAWNVRLMPLRVAWSTNEHPLGEVSLTYAAQAIRYATRMGASVLNCSFSTESQPDFDAAVSAAIQAGVTIVLAAGNNGIYSALTFREDIVVVGASDRNDVMAAFSNRNAQIDLSAPGYLLPATILSRPGTDSLGLRQPSYVIGANGTSFAAPLVAAAAALVQSRRHQLGQRPLTPLEMLLRLRDTADDISALNPVTGPADGYGTGRLNMERALTDPPTSFVVPAGGRSVGPAVVLPTLSGRSHIVFATQDRHLLFLDGVAGDTLRLVDLRDRPSGFVAAADLGGGRGTGIFVPTANSEVAGFDAVGDALPGWPVSTRLAVPSAIVGGPALGDLDGDGRLEIVAGTTDGTLWAWRADGSAVPGFPIQGLGVSQPVALTPIDGDPGVEIVLISGTDLHALRFDGFEPRGWPLTGLGLINLTPPVVTATGTDRAPTVFVSKFTGMLGIGPDGAPRMTFPLVGVGPFEPAIGDLNLDGEDELVFLLPANNQMVVLDPDPARSGGFPGWPSTLTGRPLGAPVIARVAPGASPDILDDQTGGLLAIDAQARWLSRFPPPFLTSASPTVADVDGDGAAEVMTGSTTDSMLAVVDAGPGTWSETLSPWPTLRGNFARTGSRLYAPPVARLDDTPPGAVSDLRADSVAAIGASLSWTAPAPAGGTVAGAAYELRSAPFPLTADNFSRGPSDPAVPAPLPAGTPQRFRVTTLAPEARNWIAIRCRDRAGDWSPISNVVEVTTGPIVPPPVEDLRVDAASDSSVELAWTATAAEGGRIRAASYDVRASLEPLDAAGFERASLRWRRPAAAAPGATERVSAPGLVRARDYWFAVRAEDPTGHLSPISNLASGRTDVGGPLRGRAGVAIASRMQPTRAPLELYWRGAAGAPGAQSIRLYDLQGRQVREIALGPESNGVTQWNGRDQGGRLVPAGIYFARLISGSFHAQARVVLLP